MRTIIIIVLITIFNNVRAQDKNQGIALYEQCILPELKKNKDWKSIYPIIVHQKAGEKEELLVGCTVIYYLNETDKARPGAYQNFMLAANVYAAKYPDSLKLRARNDWAWVVFTHGKSKRDLDTALNWLGPFMDQADANALDTYANLLYKSGKTKEAIIWQKKAVAAAPDRAEIKEGYEKMKKGEKTWPN